MRAGSESVAFAADARISREAESAEPSAPRVACGVDSAAPRFSTSAPTPERGTTHAPARRRDQRASRRQRFDLEQRRQLARHLTAHAALVARTRPNNRAAA